MQETLSDEQSAPLCGIAQEVWIHEQSAPLRGIAQEVWIHEQRVRAVALRRAIVLRTPCPHLTQ
eukprot:365524-Chlamydomonas_euryale.AAC.10